MIRMAHLAGITAILAFRLLSGGSAQALNLVSFVSLGGSGSTCTFSNPCSNFATALAATEPSAEIRCVDGYTTSDLIITKPITFDCNGVVTGVTNGITIDIDEATFPNAVVTLRNLTFDGFRDTTIAAGTGDGIEFTGGGAALHIENCRIFGFVQQGIEFAPTSSVDLFIRDTIVSGNAGGGVLVNPAASASVKASLDNVHLDRNGGFGLSVQKTTAGIAVANVDDTNTESNSTFGIRADGAGAIVFLSDTMITLNGTGLSTVAGGRIFSFGNNTIAGNASAGTAPTALKQQ